MLDSMRLRNSINKLVDWCVKNDLILNVMKCRIMTYSLIRMIERIYEMRDLGVIFDFKSKFSSHIG